MIDGVFKEPAADSVRVEPRFDAAGDFANKPVQDDDFELSIDHNDPLAWINFWPG
jgi:hypothetical protein